MCVCQSVWVQEPSEVRKGIGSPGTGVTIVSCHVSAGNPERRASASALPAEPSLACITTFLNYQSSV